MEYTLKIPLLVNQETHQILDGQSKILNWLYNHLLNAANELKKDYVATQNEEIVKTLYTKRGLRNLIPKLKQEEEKYFLKSVHSSPLKNTALRLSRVIQDYQKSRKGKRSGKKVGWPQFRSIKRGFFSLYYDEPNKGFKIKERELKLSLGQNIEGKRLFVKVFLEKSLNEFKNIEIRNLRIVREGDDYSACICVKKELPSKKEIKNVVSIDPNHKNLGYGVGSDGSSFEIENAYFLKNLEKRIDKVKSLRDRCKRRSKKVILNNNKEIKVPSKRWDYLNRVLQNLYRLRREQTKTYLYTVANRLYRDFDLVAIGDYTPHGGGISRKMRRVMNNHSLIGRFKDVLDWVSQRNGKHFEIWEESGTTRSCSNPSCNFVHKSSLDPQIREWDCPSCGVHHLRDENSAINGLHKIKEKNMLRCLRHLDEININSRCIWKFTGLGISSRLRGSVA
jgi:putative transposase